MAANLRSLQNAGVNIVAGSDAGNPGTHHGSSYYEEMMLMKNAGLSNLEVLWSATINAARAFGKDKLWGTLETGKEAGIILLDKNPLEDLTTLKNISMVVHRGVLIPTEKLIEETPEMLVQRQVNAFNARNPDEFLSIYSDSAELYTFPDKLMAKGKARLKPMYEGAFLNPELHAEISDRVVKDNIVIDQEGKKGKGVLVMYEVKDGKIVKAWFIQ